MSYKEVGERIRYLREVNNYTREAFAEKVGISSKFLYEIEMGKKGFSADTLLKISQALAVSCDYLMIGYNAESRTAEQIACILEGLEPKQIGRVRDILMLIREMCV